MGSVPWIISNVTEVATSLCLRSDKNVKSKLGFAESSVGKESACNAGDPLDSWVGKILWRRVRLPTPGFLGSPGGSAGKELTPNVGDLGLISVLGRSPGEGKGYHSSILAWRIPWTIQSMGLQRAGRD